jgi:hypothetical protein
MKERKERGGGVRREEDRERKREDMLDPASNTSK